MTEMIKKRIKAFCLSPMFPICVLWVVFAVAHIFFPTNRADDVWFAARLEDGETLASFLKWRYEAWSSRIAIEALLVILVKNPLLWKITDTLICIAISFLLMRLVNPERDRLKNIILCAGWFVYPTYLTWAAGFVATTLNYTWPLAAALFAVTPFIKQFFKREVKLWEYIIALPMLWLACFQELLCATLLLAVLGSLVYRVFFEKRFPIFQLASFAICLAMLMFALTCPGNDNRTFSEIGTWFPEYADFSTLLKLELGFSSTMKVMFLDVNYFVLLFCLALSVLVWLTSKSRLKRLLACIPTCFVLVFGMLGGILGRYIPWVAYVKYWVGAMGSGFMITSPLTWIPDLTFVALLALILLSMRWVIEDTKQYCFLFFLLFLGAASRMAMGLSPTVWASGNRSCIFLYLAMAVVMGYMVLGIVGKIEEKIKKK